MMDRRTFLAGTSAMLLAAPLAAEAQPVRKVHRIGFIGNANPTEGRILVDALRQGLRELGWVEGQNISIVYRWAEGDLGRSPQLVAELVALNVDMIVLAGTVAARAALQATRTIPIVITIVGDPVAGGLVTSLAKPGGNLTGLAWEANDLATKQLQLLLEAVPQTTRVAALGHSANPTARTAAEAAARSLGVKLDVINIGLPADIPAAFEAAKRGRPGALIVLPSPMFYGERRRLAELAVRHRLPAIYETKAYVEAGGLASYGPSFPDMYRRAATYVDKILKGAEPGDLPMEQPTKFELVINLKAAKALGLTIPPSLLGRADEVIHQ
jgi:putative tryptophan/tyrosine transport system substrate-binding protein